LSSISEREDDVAAYGLKILATGSYTPPRVMTNADFEKFLDTSDEWITTRTGIRERHIADDSVTTSDLAVEASRIAIRDAGLVHDDIDTIIVATVTPDMFFPSSACFVHKKLGISHEVIAFDVFAACTGFVYGMATAAAYLRSGLSKNVLLIGAETLSKFVDWKDRGTCILFGDGAGAMVLQRTDDPSQDAVRSVYLGADGNYDHLLSCPGGGSKYRVTHESVDANLHTLKMSGKEVFKVAVNSMVRAVEEACTRAGISPQQLDLLIPHQANLRIINAVGERVSGSEGKVFVNVHKYGNMSSATTIVALDEAIREGRVKPGSLVCMVAFGGGFTWGAAVIRL
jgi:3-oxoacyl-[acyl-carrier-protein] synthase-3